MRPCLRKPSPWVALLLGVHAALLAYGAAVHSPTLDEVAHFPAGLRVASTCIVSTPHSFASSPRFRFIWLRTSTSPGPRATSIPPIGQNGASAAR
jgi:hypothetical protein